MLAESATTRIARIALAIQRGGGDHLGDVNSIHEDFIALVNDLKACKRALNEIDNSYGLGKVYLPPELRVLVVSALL